MPTEQPTFFAIEDNLAALRQLLTALPENAKQSGQPILCAPHLRQIVQVIVKNAGSFDELCQSNIKWIGEKFISSARNLEKNSESEFSSESVAELFSMAYRFLCEIEFSMPGDLSLELRSVKKFVDENLEALPADVRRQLVFANYIMPAGIARAMLQHPDMAAMREYNERYASASELKTQWDAEVAIKESQVNALKEQLGKLETGFNFVGLVDGFHQLSRQKQNEKCVAFISLLALGTIILSPVIGELVFIYLNRDELDAYKQVFLFALPPLLAIEILLIYFFRVVLVHFRSIKVQLLQLQLRAALCQFIQSYSTFATEIKQKDAAALEKFESQIFSGIILSEENLPSTFDGTEQLAKLIRGIKSPA